MARKLNLKEFISDDTIDLSLNDLQDVPVKEIANFPKATSLDLSNNKLTLLTKSFATSLTHLVKLDLARNDLRELPKNFGCLVNLKHLDLYKNRLTTLPLSFANIKALRWLDIKDNPLEPHWHHIVGPCLNAQDCKAAAKNVVNVASMMNEEINTEVIKNQARQKQIEETELREQAKKKEKQKEKKKRKNAAKLAEANHKNLIENGEIFEAETAELTDNDENLEIPVKNNNHYSIGGTLKTFFSGLFKTMVYFLLASTLALLLLKFLNEPIYKSVMPVLYNYAQPAIGLIPDPVRIIWHKWNNKLISNVRFIAKITVTGLEIFYKWFVNAYVFMCTDPRVDLYLKFLIERFLSLYSEICKFVSTFFNNGSQIKIN